MKLHRQRIGQTRKIMRLEISENGTQKTFDVSIGGFLAFSFDEDEIQALALLLYKAGVLNQLIEVNR